MPKVSFADITVEWEALIRAVDESPDLTASGAHRDALAAKLERIRELKAMQMAARATKQVCTQQLRHELGEAKMLAVQLRSSIRSFIDPRNERLVRYKMAPIRKGPRRAAGAAGAAADTPTAPAGPAEPPALAGTGEPPADTD